MKLTADERDLLHHLVTGSNTRANGDPLACGSWMAAVLESLLGKRLVSREEHPDTRAALHFATDAGRRALQEGE